MVKGKKPMMKRRSRIRKRPAKYNLPADAVVEYKDIPLLQNYLTDRGKILSRRLTGVTGKQQRELSASIKRARYLGLLPVGGVKN